MVGKPLKAGGMWHGFPGPCEVRFAIFILKMQREVSVIIERFLVALLLEMTEGNLLQSHQNGGRSWISKNCSILISIKISDKYVSFCRCVVLPDALPDAPPFFVRNFGGY